MTRCPATLSGGPLICVRPTGHPDAHEFHATAGCDLDNSTGPKYHADGGDQ